MVKENVPATCFPIYPVHFLVMLRLTGAYRGQRDVPGVVYGRVLSRYGAGRDTGSTLGAVTEGLCRPLRNTNGHTCIQCLALGAHLPLTYSPSTGTASIWTLNDSVLKKKSINWSYLFVLFICFPGSELVKNMWFSTLYSTGWTTEQEVKRYK